MKKPLIGAHVSFKQKTQLLGTLHDLNEIEATSGAMYISNSRAYKKTLILDEDNLKEAKEFAKKINFNIKNIIVHAPLIGNLANNDEDLKIFNATVYSYTEDVKLMEKMGLKYFNFHPGSFRKREEGIKRCAFGINKIIEKTKNSNVILCIETMMKKGNYIGKNFNEIREIIDLVENKKRIGVVMDTCHIWDGGYDIRNIDEVLNEFDKIIGLHYLKGMHINDSKNELGSNKDRHANIGKGEIGLEALKKIVFHPKLINLPKALETPYGKDDFKRWKEEISLLID
ncbi:MAG: deoxyribonuclease IV [Candidatus Hepatoplasma vulgare]|nr:MAG: deoxyribonuclease IV [Candidatus Hepatoplasma sp.]